MGRRGDDQLHGSVVGRRSGSLLRSVVAVVVVGRRSMHVMGGRRSMHVMVGWRGVVGRRGMGSRSVHVLVGRRGDDHLHGSVVVRSGSFLWSVVVVVVVEEVVVMVVLLLTWWRSLVFFRLRYQSIPHSLFYPIQRREENLIKFSNGLAF